MTLQLVCFYALATVMVGSALAVITVKNSVHAALFLVLTFFTAASTWILAEAEFLGIALVVVYVGAVMVLFLFVVMMLDIKPESMREGFIRFLPVGVIVAAVMLVEMLALIGVKAMTAQTLPPDPAVAAGMGNTAWLGKALFTQFLLPFEIAALILTVALIAAVALTLRKRTGTKTQNPGLQVMVKREERLRVVKMSAERGEGESA
ncbi:NADH-quinone oxidoreductase subunit J [Tahibacter amnicola]|uniref:NADH-quinone oxidoreductase subunit J n=1 Tax=Tahibacter amnicola TaxID=2976241 RepID=A0ABY6BJG9_9GAMM|nr:NADH-quinone oxidoreductase subunit J [Tahibacter amnicola]UXI69736.1 NADH-quinone oxidoreductase subunit J [Tahibacter amnicola]